jgi:hypothetical protein
VSKAPIAVAVPTVVPVAGPNGPPPGIELVLLKEFDNDTGAPSLVKLNTFGGSGTVISTKMGAGEAPTSGIGAMSVSVETNPRTNTVATG